MATDAIAPRFTTALVVEISYYPYVTYYFDHEHLNFVNLKAALTD